MLERLSAKNLTLVLTISSLVIFASILLGSIYVNQKNKLQQLEKEYRNSIKNSYDVILENHKKFYNFRLKANINSKGVKEAFATRNREELYSLIEARWKVLQSENQYLKIMHFHLPNGISFLRMHQPKKYADEIAQRREMVATMHKIQKPLYGFEAGAYMLAYRTFLPAFYQGKYIGAVELGSRPDQLLYEIDKFNNIKGALFVKNNKIIEYQEKSDLIIGDYKLQYSTMNNNEVLKHLNKNLDADSLLNIYDKYYSVYVFDLKDYNEKTSAKIVFLHDITSIKNEFSDTVEELVILLFSLLFLLVIVIHYGFGKIIKKLEKTNNKLLSNKQFTDSILTKSSYAIITLDTKGKITLFNKKAESLLGYSSDELVNKQSPLIFHKKSEIKKKIKELLKDPNVGTKKNYRQLIIQSAQTFEDYDEWTYIHKSGKEVKVSLYITTLSDTEGNMTGYLIMAEDISLRKQLEAEIKAQKNELETIFHTTKDGIATLDLQTNFLYCNDAYLEMTGFTHKELLQTSCVALTAPEDLPRIEKGMQEIMEKGYLNNFEKTCIVKNNKRLAVNMSLALMPDKKRILVSMKDITEQKEKEKIIKDYVALIDKYIITSSIDLNGNIIDVSDAFCDISGYTKEELLEMNFTQIKPSDMDTDVLDEMFETLKRDMTWSGEIKHQTKNGNYYWLQVSVSPTYDKYGKKNYYTFVGQNITGKKTLEEISITDALTNIYNRRHFNEVFPQVLKSAQREPHTYQCFLMIDIDHFKQYNDHYGHQKGDESLILVAKAIKNSLNRASDYCFRLGGEEFGVLYKVDTKEKAIKFAEYIRKNVEDLKIEHKYSSTNPYITISIGLVAVQGSHAKSENISEVYKNADSLLYEAKISGRNQVKSN
jgi:diguanylate cyclase (GGDEF)-like protein/PAS domain S-box-containing protein